MKMKMKINYRKTATITAGLLVASIVHASGETSINTYRDAGAGPFSASAGQAEWIKEYPAPTGAGTRNCSSCHGANLGEPGKHIKTGKRIEPMSGSVNPTRLNDPEKVEKWFRRNCRWTLGRECTPQEKGDFIRYINQS